MTNEDLAPTETAETVEQSQPKSFSRLTEKHQHLCGYCGIACGNKVIIEKTSQNQQQIFRN